MKIWFRVSLTIVIVATALTGYSQSQDRFLDIPKNHWAYEIVESGYSLVNPYAGSFYHHYYPENRTKFLLDVVRLINLIEEKYQVLESVIEDSEKRLTNEDRFKINRELVQTQHSRRITATEKILELNQAVRRLPPVLNEFNNELKQLQSQKNGDIYKLTELKYRTRLLELSTISYWKQDESLGSPFLRNQSDINLERDSGRKRALLKINKDLVNAFYPTSSMDSQNEENYSSIELMALGISHFNRLMQIDEGFTAEIERWRLYLSKTVSGSLAQTIAVEVFLGKERQAVKFFGSKRASLKALIQLISYFGPELEKYFRVDFDAMKKDIMDFPWGVSSSMKDRF